MIYESTINQRFAAQERQHVYRPERDRQDPANGRHRIGNRLDRQQASPRLYCLREMQEKNDGRCVFDDDICNAVSAKFAEADGFVFGSPVYYGQPNGALLAIMQRAFFSNGANLQNKPGAAVTICRRGGATAAFEALQMPMQMLNMPLATSQYWNIAYGREEGQSAQDTEGMQTMRTLAHNLAWILRGLRGENAPALPDREPWQPMHFIR